MMDNQNKPPSANDIRRAIIEEIRSQLVDPNITVAKRDNLMDVARQMEIQLGIEINLTGIA
jgi:hypothetical protein